MKSLSKLPKPKKKVKLSSLKNKVWKLFSEYIRRKYSDKVGYCTCVTCGKRDKWENMQASHFIDGRMNSILFVEVGVHPCCYRCNIMLKGNKVEYFRFMQKKYGDEVIDKLRFLKHVTVKFKDWELQVMIEDYKRRIEKLERR